MVIEKKGFAPMCDFAPLNLCLASASPRRREILGLITRDFTVCVSGEDEVLPHQMPAEEMVQYLARQKAQAVAKSRPDCTVLGSDTMVGLDGRTYGKPRDRDHAAEMLRTFSGTDHQVHTGVCILRGQREIVFCETVQMHMRPITEAELQAYLDTGLWADKAGAYGINGPAAAFFTGIEGDFYAAFGLPLCRVYQVLTELLADAGH